MAFRQYDFECTDCKSMHTDLVWVDTGADVPSLVQLTCPQCAEQTTHQRLMSAPAYYTYDRPYYPQVMGGKFDTMGGRKAPPVPILPDGATFDQARDFLTSKHMKETMAMKRHVDAENHLKQQRLAAMQKGENVDLRTNPLPGDPPLEKPAKTKRKRKKPSKKPGFLHNVRGGKFGS